jgi:transposase InsO family protein
VVLGREWRKRISRKRVQRLMRVMGIEALYPKPNLSRPAAGHETYPYLLRDVVVSRPNQVWSIDITYIPMRSGFLYLVAIMDWFSRFESPVRAPRGQVLLQSASSGHTQGPASLR